ncbi:hypothetical protein [Dokdonella sp.]|uniref:hypothetical protein n=1 Tax=Dokdonella sp. TaxID=2291710 RepID=UPI0031CC2041|nr:hypothetical protein [Dokdonella sp.]
MADSSAIDLARLVATQYHARWGRACVHGALLQVDGAGVLVVGQRASGKSVLSASALAAGGGIVSDDYLLVAKREDGVFGERIREFLSLRRSWAGEALVDLTGLEWSLGRSGNRAYLRVPEGDARFPVHARIDRIWVLRRPRAGRRQHSSLEAMSHAEVYAALVTAIQPLLLGPDFPHERAQLQTLLAGLMASAPAARLETGQDVVTDPAATWHRLLGERVG